MDPSKIFTFKDLKEEWKKHSAFGFVLGLLMWRNKSNKSYEKRNILEVDQEKKLNVGKNEDTSRNYLKKYQTDVNKLNEIFLDLVYHFYNNGYL